MKKTMTLKTNIKTDNVNCDVETDISVINIIKELEKENIKVPKDDEKALEEIINIFILGFRFGCNISQELSNALNDIFKPTNKEEDTDEKDNEDTDEDNIIPFN